jgi:hypothetical protein
MWKQFMGMALVACLGLTQPIQAAADSTAPSQCQLDYPIPPEIKNDAFYEAIYRLARTEKVKHILEIGSSSGDGSTEAFAKGIRENPNRPQLYCMEVAKARFDQLKKCYRSEPQIHCYNVSSIPLEKFPSEHEVQRFYYSTPTNLNRNPLPLVMKWLRQDIDYIKRENASQDGIALIRRENKIKDFDMVLIDGSEFTGKAELDEVYGAKIILLDDTFTFKNYANYERLKQDPAYALVEENQVLRNGYAIFKRKEPS